MSQGTTQITSEDCERGSRFDSRTQSSELDSLTVALGAHPIIFLQRSCSIYGRLRILKLPVSISVDI